MCGNRVHLWSRSALDTSALAIPEIDRRQCCGDREQLLWCIVCGRIRMVTDLLANIIGRMKHPSPWDRLATYRFSAVATFGQNGEARSAARHDCDRRLFLPEVPAPKLIGNEQTHAG